MEILMDKSESYDLDVIEQYLLECELAVRPCRPQKTLNPVKRYRMKKRKELQQCVDSLETKLQDAKCEIELLLIRNLRYEVEARKLHQQLEKYAATQADLYTQLQTVNSQINHSLCTLQHATPPDRNSRHSPDDTAKVGEVSDGLADDNTDKLRCLMKSVESVVNEIQAFADDTCHRKAIVGDLALADQEALGSGDNNDTELSISEPQRLLQHVHTLRTDRKKLTAELYVATDFLEKLSFQVEEQKREIHCLKTKARSGAQPTLAGFSHSRSGLSQ